MTHCKFYCKVSYSCIDILLHSSREEHTTMYDEALWVYKDCNCNCIGGGGGGVEGQVYHYF